MTEPELLATITAYLAQGTRPAVPLYVHPSLMQDVLTASHNMNMAPTHKVGDSTLTSNTLAAYKAALLNYHQTGADLDAALAAVKAALTAYIDSRAILVDATVAIQNVLHP